MLGHGVPVWASSTVLSKTQAASVHPGQAPGARLLSCTSPTAQRTASRADVPCPDMRHRKATQPSDSRVPVPRSVGRLHIRNE